MKYSPTHIATYLANKKRLLYLAVLAGAVLLISVGVWAEGKITDSAEQTARKYQTAIKAANDKELNYSIDTKQGNVLVETVVNQVDTVKFPEMNKSFPKVKKTKERYTRHERTVCETKYRTETRTRVFTDSEGNRNTETYTVEVPYDECHEETYYSWDHVDSWEQSAKEVGMAGRKYPIEIFALHMEPVDAKDIIDGEDGKYVMEEADTFFDVDIGIFKEADEGDVRYSFDVLRLPKAGTIFIDVTNGVKPVFGSRIDLKTEKPEQMIKSAQESAQTQSTVFTVIWSIFVLSVLIGGAYAVYQY